MPFIEAPTTFYLGRRLDPESRRIMDEVVYYESRDLTTHAVVVGMTGSGKTGLCITLLEEAILDGLPAIIIDPKGDITNLLLSFPNLTPEEFLPWINLDDAHRAGLEPYEYAQDVANRWREGLQSWGIGPRRIAALKNAAQFTIYTPGSDAGAPISILDAMQAPREGWAGNEEFHRERIKAITTALLALIGMSANPVKDREHVLISNIFEFAWRQGVTLTVQDIIVQVQQPPFDKLGVLDIDTFFPEKDRFKLALELNNIIAAPSFQSWLQGEPLDIGNLLYTPQGQPRVSVFYIAHLTEAQRSFMITLLLESMLASMRAMRGTSSLRALLYFDEVFGHFPPYPKNPPTKEPLLRLLKQARAFGIGLVLATQNPGDLDYKGLSNAGTWFIGRLQTENDKKKVLDGLLTASTTASSLNIADLDQMISSVEPRVFVMNNVHDRGGPILLHTRWAMTYLSGPMTRQQVNQLMRAQWEYQNSPQGQWRPPQYQQPAATPAGYGAPPTQQYGAPPAQQYGTPQQQYTPPAYTPPPAPPAPPPLQASPYGTPAFNVVSPPPAPFAAAPPASLPELPGSFSSAPPPPPTSLPESVGGYGTSNYAAPSAPFSQPYAPQTPPTAPYQSGGYVPPAPNQYTPPPPPFLPGSAFNQPSVNAMPQYGQNPYAQGQGGQNPYAVQNPYAQQQGFQAASSPQNPYAQQQTFQPPSSPQNPYAQQSGSPPNPYGGTGSYTPAPSPYDSGGYQPPQALPSDMQGTGGAKPPAKTAGEPTNVNIINRDQSLPQGFTYTRPALPSSIEQYFLPVTVSRQQIVSRWERQYGMRAGNISQELITYVPFLLAQIQIRYMDRKSGINMVEVYAYHVRDVPRAGFVRWDQYRARPVSSTSVSHSPLDESAAFGDLTAGLADSKRITALKKEIVDYVYQSAAIVVPLNPTLGIFGTPGTGFRDFQMQVNAAAREARDQEIDKVTAKYEKLFDQLEEKFRREERELQADRLQVRDLGREQLFTAGEAAISILQGRTAYTLSRVSRTNRYKGQAQEEVRESEQVINQIQAEMDALQGRFEMELQQVNQKWNQIARHTEEYRLTPLKKDIFHELFGIAWMPQYLLTVNNQQSVLPAWEPGNTPDSGPRQPPQVSSRPQAQLPAQPYQNQDQYTVPYGEQNADMGYSDQQEWNANYDDGQYYAGDNLRY